MNLLIATLGMLFTWYCQMLVFIDGLVCGVRADLRSLHCVSENNYGHPFWPRFNVSVICTICIDVPETDRLFVELGHMLEYHLATAHWVANHPIVHSGPLHKYPGFYESATIYFRIQKFPRPHVSTLKSNFPVHTYPDSL